jgi:hypothetical protein
VYSPWQQPLAEAMQELQGSGLAVMLQLSESWMRQYQVGGTYIIAALIYHQAASVGRSRGQGRRCCQFHNWKAVLYEEAARNHGCQGTP